MIVLLRCPKADQGTCRRNPLGRHQACDHGRNPGPHVARSASFRGQPGAFGRLSRPGVPLARRRPVFQQPCFRGRRRQRLLALPPRSGGSRPGCGSLLKRIPCPRLDRVTCFVSGLTARIPAVRVGLMVPCYIESHGGRRRPQISPGVSQLICTSAVQVQPNLKKCSLK